jgi:hypothetical protein
VSGVKEAFADAAAMRRHRRTAPTTVPAQTTCDACIGSGNFWNGVGCVTAVGRQCLPSPPAHCLVSVCCSRSPCPLRSILDFIVYRAQASIHSPLDFQKQMPSPCLSLCVSPVRDVTVKLRVDVLWVCSPCIPWWLAYCPGRCLQATGNAAFMGKCVEVDCS